MIFYSSLLGFLGLPKETVSKNKVCVIPFGLEKSVSYGSGTKYGPKAMINASHQVVLFDEELLLEPYKKFQVKTLKPFVIKKKTKSSAWTINSNYKKNLR